MEQFIIVPNESLPEYPVKPVPPPKGALDDVLRKYTLDLSIWKKEEAALQATVPYPHCHGSDNLSWRRMVHAYTSADFYFEHIASDGVKERVSVWVGSTCPKNLPATVVPMHRSEEWHVDCIGRSRYEFLTFEPKDTTLRKGQE